MAPLSWNEIKSRAVAFSKEWVNEGYEDGEAKSFLDDFFNVFGVSRRRFVKFESRVKTEGGHSGYIDSIWKGVILVEMKSLGKNLDKAYDQARGYFYGLTESELPRYVLVSDFQNFRLYDLDENLQWDIPLRDLVKKVKLFGFLAGYQHTDLKEQDPVNIRAAEEMGKIHDEMKAIGYSGHRLELYLVRILFCLFADDTTLFNKNQFYDYVMQSREDGSDLAMRLGQLFEVLNTPQDNRLTSLLEDLAGFPYVNGQLFSEQLPMAGFTSQMRQHLLNCCRVDWGSVNPAIFGSMFQSVMNPAERRALGAHYTSEKNIHKVINPLFLNELKAELENCKNNKRRLQAFHNKIAGLKFLDPACGCGNFLIIAYQELRHIEIEIMKSLLGSERMLDIVEMAKVNVNQFYGIEIEEFPAQIAQVAMWLIDHQMNMKISEEFGLYYARLPLTTRANILNANALEMDWQNFIPPDQLSFIFGNPPFQGARTMSVDQKNDLLRVFDGVKGVGNLDFVTAWYKKAAEYIQGTNISASFVSTNSICQGEQVSILWDELMGKYNIQINFAYRTFKWSNEARGRAAVHCVIVGFATFHYPIKQIFDGQMVSLARNINPYLVDAPNITVKSRNRPLCHVPSIGIGNKPIDGGHYLFTKEEMRDFIKVEPRSEYWFKKWIGSDEFINGWHRYCLWLGDCPPSELRSMPEAVKRIDAVKAHRLASRSEQTRKLAAYPTRFHVENIPNTPCVVIPEVSSERRAYIPIGYVGPEYLCSNKLRLMPNATLFHFGVLTSEMHMAWTRYVCGRLKSDYSYSIDIVYNNFPWPEPTERQRLAIEAAGQAVFDVRDSFATATLAELYDQITMPPELVKAHNKLDAEVEKAYGRRFNSDANRVTFLFEKYAELIKI